jgi:large subunit ribosomal protein L16
MLQSKKRKYAKDFRGRRKGVSVRGSSLAFGEFGLKALEAAWVSASQLEAARRAITHNLKKGGRVWMRVFPDKPVSARAAGKRMGGGKGDVARYVAVITPGKIIFEVAGAVEDIVQTAFQRAGSKLPIKTKMISKEG